MEKRVKKRKYGRAITKEEYTKNERKREQTDTKPREKEGE